MLNWILAAVAFLCISLAASQSFAQNQTFEKNTLEVTGRGEIQTKPDVAYISFGVETTTKKASDAVAENAEKMKNVIDKLKAQIGKEDKITTSGYQLYPLYEYNEGTKKNDLTGYRAYNMVIVETRNLDRIGKLIDSSTQVGANRVENLSFGTKNNEQYRREGLVKAVKDARETAEIVAGAAGVKVVRILRISPSYDVPRPVYKEFMAARAMDVAQAAPTPIEPGEITVSATVTIVFEIQ